MYGGNTPLLIVQSVRGITRTREILQYDTPKYILKKKFIMYCCPFIYQNKYSLTLFYEMEKSAEKKKNVKLAGSSSR